MYVAWERYSTMLNEKGKLNTNKVIVRWVIVCIMCGFVLCVCTYGRSSTFCSVDKACITLHVQNITPHTHACIHSCTHNNLALSLQFRRGDGVMSVSWNRSWGSHQSRFKGSQPVCPHHAVRVARCNTTTVFRGGCTEVGTLETSGSTRRIGLFSINCNLIIMEKSNFLKWHIHRCSRLYTTVVNNEDLWSIWPAGNKKLNRDSSKHTAWREHAFGW